MRLIVLRGPEPVGPFELPEGPSIVGRDPSCPIHLPSKRVSRKHAVLLVAGDSVTARDLGSHNGILDAAGERVNSTPLTPGSRVQIGDYVLMIEAPLVPTEDDLQLDDESGETVLDDEELETDDEASTPAAPIPPVHREIPASISGSRPKLPFGPPTGGFGSAPSLVPPSPPSPPASPPPPPPTPVAEVTDAGPITQPPSAPPPVQTAKMALVPQLAVVLVLLVGLVLCAPVGGIFAQLFAGRSAVREASMLRGEQIADALGNRNAQAIAESRNLALDTVFVSDRPGVRSALLADNRGTVLAPPEKLRTTIAGHAAYSAALRNHDVARAETQDGTWEIVTPVRAEIAGSSGPRQIVGFALIEYDPDVVTSGLLTPWLRALAGLAVAAIAAGVALGAGWWLVYRPLHALREETELALHGDVERVVPPLRWGPYEELAHSINRVLLRARK